MENKGDKSGNIEKPKKKSKRLWIILLIICFVLVSIGGTYYGVKNKEVIAKKIAARKENTPLQSATLNQFIINLSDLNFKRYLKITLVVEYKDKKTGDEITGKDYKIRDAIINLLSSKSAEDIKDIEGKGKIKQELIEIINNNLEQGKIENLYWTDFVIQ